MEADPFSSSHSRLPDDTVFYAIYPDFTVSPSTTAATTEQLHSLHLQLLQSISPFISSYIWQHQPFTLSPSPPSDPLPHLHGNLRFGDNLHDEWFVVFLLYHLSRSFPFLSIRVWDSDGDFLLIESAFHLPRWLDPHTSTNRVFLRNGHLHIIPRRLFPSPPSLCDALYCLISHPAKETLAPDSVQSAIQNRISGYPELALKNTHWVRVRVPVRVAQVLKHEPCFISLAVDGFYDRDIDTMKFAAQMNKFCPNGKEEDLVTVSVRMSRAMYAQLVQQTFQPPNKYPMPARGDDSYMEAEIGLKIACGLEMMYQQRKKVGDQGRGTTSEAFMDSLHNSGYFQDFIPGSKEYKRLMATAEEYYRNTSAHQKASEMLSAPVRRIDEILSLPHSAEDFMGQEVPLSDDDSWLYGGEEELNAAMMERQKEMEVYEQERKRKSKGKEKETDISSSTNQGDFDLGDIAKTMQAFVQKVSSYEGAEVPEDGNLQSVDFDADRFMKEMDAAMRATRGEGDDTDVDIEDGSSSDIDFDDSEDGSDMEELPEFDKHASEETFMQTYSDSLNEELKGSTLKESFVRASDQSPNKDEGISNTTEEMDTEFSPVDVDVNLVKSLLDSFSSQQGLPGPASNLLGLMGMKLPDDVAAKKK